MAVGATAILIPEVKYDFKRDVIDKIKYTQNLGRRHFIVVVAEGCEKTMEISNKITEGTGIESRCTILGHVQRGGSPTLRDRVLAGIMGSHAVKTIFNSSESKAISSKCDRIIDYNIDEALKIKKQKGKNGKQCCSARQYRRNEEHPAPGAAFGKKLILHFLVKARGNLLRRAHLRDDLIDALSFFQPGVDIGADVPVDARFCFQRQAQLPLDGIDIALDLFLLFRLNCSSLSNPSTQSAKARHALRCTA